MDKDSVDYEIFRICYLKKYIHDLNFHTDGPSKWASLCCATAAINRHGYCIVYIIG